MCRKKIVRTRITPDYAHARVCGGVCIVFKKAEMISLSISGVRPYMVIVIYALAVILLAVFSFAKGQRCGFDK